MALAFILFENTFINLVTVTFTSLIVIEVLNVFSEINQITLLILLA
jgi:phospholipid-translocating ATPase